MRWKAWIFLWISAGNVWRVWSVHRGRRAVSGFAFNYLTMDWTMCSISDWLFPRVSFLQSGIILPIGLKFNEFRLDLTQEFFCFNILRITATMCRIPFSKSDETALNIWCDGFCEFSKLPNAVFWQQPINVNVLLCY